MEAGTSSYSLADPARLETIDKLFEYNIGDSVALPQVRLYWFYNFATHQLTVTKAFGCWRPIKVYQHILLMTKWLISNFNDSGKSSVLEGLTNLPFPRDHGLCTRFATQITFRRAREKSMAISLIPSNDASPDHAEKLRAWKKDDFDLLEGSKFSETIKEAS